MRFVYENAFDDIGNNNNNFAELARHFLAGAENFDTRVWVVAVGIVMGTLTVLGLGTCYLLYLECRTPAGKSRVSAARTQPLNHFTC